MVEARVYIESYEIATIDGVNAVYSSRVFSGMMLIRLGKLGTGPTPR